MTSDGVLAGVAARASDDVRGGDALHPDHDLIARRSRAWDRHWRNAARIAAMRRDARATPDVPFWQPSRQWLARQRAESAKVEAEMIDAVEYGGRPAVVSLIDAMAVAVRRIEAGDPSAARDRLERALDETFSDWRRVCPW